jgi:hypothetical protein
LSAFALATAIRWRPALERLWALRGLTSALLLTLIGVELAVLVTWLPHTLEMWWRADRLGDFGSFFTAAEELRPNGLYSPGLSLLLYPLTHAGIQNAYRVYVGLGALAVLGVAYLAQRGVGSPEGRLAVALGVISIPQMHWALRLGHLTPFLALAALSGFLLLRRRPYLAGICFALLILKPQYAPIPALYLLWTRNGRALAAMVGTVAVLEVAGFAAAGFGAVGPYLASFFDWGADARDNLLPYQQAWQYAWQGFLISAGFEPNPLVIFDLVVVSLAVVVLVWHKAGGFVAAAAAALGMLLVTPYANFYDWGLLVVAGALLLRAEIAWKAMLPVIVVGLYAALLVSQQATPFPAVDVELAALGTGGNFTITPAGFTSPTRGIYWVTPAALAVAAFLALVGRRDGERDAAADGPPAGTVPAALSRTVDAARERLSGVVPSVGRLALAGLLISTAFFTAAYVAHAPPFAQAYDPFSKGEVLKQIPSDFPLPPDRKLVTAGEGEELPYRIEWTSGAPASEVAEIYRELLAGDSWELMLAESSGSSYRVRLARFTPYRFMTHWGMLDVSPEQDGSRITLDLFVTQMLTLTSGGSGDSP